MRFLTPGTEGIVKSTLEILNLLAFLLGSPDYAQPNMEACQKPGPAPVQANRPTEKRLSKKAGN
jgi:hypothetical protein